MQGKLYPPEGDYTMSAVVNKVEVKFGRQILDPWYLTFYSIAAVSLDYVHCFKAYEGLKDLVLARPGFQGKCLVEMSGGDVC